MSAAHKTLSEIRSGGISCGGRLVEEEDHAATGQVRALRRAGGRQDGVGDNDD